MLSEAVDGLVPADPLGPVAVTAPTLAVNLHGRGPESTETLRQTGPSSLWAFDLPGGCPWEPPTLARAGSADEHEVSRWCRLLAAYGVSCDPTELGLQVPPGLPPVRGGWARDPTATRAARRRETTGRGEGSAPCPTVIHPGGAAPARRWPGRRWAAVARQLARDGHQIALTGSAAEHGLALRVATAAGLPHPRCWPEGWTSSRSVPSSRVPTWC
ncbi:glycosyltransferase family 9 protein [Parafrankia discariae]|uniref:glycosyltransferase family 9 protein n=1 Tax=Parafrankia discariae TaxID=365528 RepID=UPI00227E5D3F|nr:glycosyltransferase family 9 protein [Parafrankia discariae]